ncbi:MAG: O-antigen ligase family protein [Candidatus Pseudobacter hemicellulosilyticus]|uniref:O-antigen ligase family protein n=1 Tax=Candidatus Pseudobacter hemicellulosilyticus TaxID=3121375 RepID=A0AAJ5WY16_9BACT|nr:MAG: O-antigen ligase family protein [Pseudobacter sp.]
MFMRTLFLKDETGTDFSRKEKMLYVLIAGFFISFYLRSHPVINNSVIGLLFIFSFYYNGLREKVRLLWQRKAVLLMLLFFLLHLISSLFSSNKQEALDMLALRSPLLLFPVSLGLIVISGKLKDRILWLYNLVTTGAAAVCLGWALVLYRQTGNAALLYNDSLSDAIGKQSIYFALMINLAVFSWVYLLNKRVSFINRGLAYCSILFLLFIHFLLASRMNMIVLYTCLLGYAVYYIIRRRKILEGLILVMGLVIGAFLLFKMFPKTFNRFRELGYTEYQFNNKAVESHYNMEVTADQWNGANIRLAIWQCGWELARTHWLTGVQLGDKEDRLMEVYREKDFQFAVKTQRNLHSNYLDVLVSFGVIGLLLFVTGYLLLPLLSCLRQHDGIGVFIVLAFAAAFFSETYFDRSMGAVLAGFFLSFVLSDKRLAAGKVTDCPPGTA